MRNTLLLIFITVLQAYADDTYSQNTKLTLNLNNVTVANVLEEIQNKSEFYFLFNAKLIDVEREVSISMEDKKISEILTSLFSGTEVNYLVYDRQIILTPSDVTSLSAAMQQQKITGTVTEKDGTPLPGVNVVITGTTLGVMTDIDGKYSIDVPQGAKSLTFSFVGMEPQEISIGTLTQINVTMAESVIGLEEVLVIGYGTVKKSDLTGAVGFVTGDIIANRQSTQVSQALQGAMAGVMVTRNNNSPGSIATIRIRGVTTIGDSNPLVIIDGVPSGSIDDINPDDVESISVLKDAASASIYGSRAAAGVILITTKRAKTGQLGFDYSVEYGFEKPTQVPEFVDVVRFMELSNELRWNDNGNIPGLENSYYNKDVIDNYASLHAEDPDLYPSTDWVDLILKKKAPRQSHVLSITAGTEKIRSKALVSYNKIGGLYEGRSFERLTARLNNDVTVNKYLSATLDIFFMNSIDKSPSSFSLGEIWTTAPVYAAVWSDGRLGEGKTDVNPYGKLMYGGDRNNRNNQVGGKVSLDFAPFKGFKLSAIISPILNFNKEKNFVKKIPYYDKDDPTVLIGYFQKTTSVSENRDDSHNVTAQLIANYIKSFGRHNLNTMVGYENYYSFTEKLMASRSNYLLDSYPYLDIGPLEFRDNSGGASENGYRSHFGRIMYNYQNKYFLQGNLRIDGSSRFDKDYRWGSFPSFSVGWTLSEEPFMKKIPTLSFLKLRGSWGRLGNERIGNYPYQATIKFFNVVLYQGSNVAGAQAAAQSGIPVRDISWETTESIDFGIDANIFADKLRFSGDYYMKTTKDMLLALEIPDYIGFDNPLQNSGKMKTKGLEIEIAWSDRIGNLGYSVSANLSDFKSVMGDLGGTEFLGDQIKIEGSEFNEWYGFKSDGLFQTKEEVSSSPKLFASTRPGDIKYQDISGPDGIPDGIISSEYDRILLGGSLPRYMYGGTIRLDYKNFDFSMVIQGVGKQNVRLQGPMIFVNNWNNFAANLDGNSYSYYNTAEENLKAKYPRVSYSSSAFNYLMSDFWLINGAYLRCKNITLGYNVPQQLTRKLDIQGFRVYTSISDLFTIDNYLKGWDPEVSSTGYPITSSFILGVDLKF